MISHRPYHVPPLLLHWHPGSQFSGLAEVDLGASTSLTLQLSMAGTIPRVFGVERLSIGDVAGSGMYGGFFKEMQSTMGIDAAIDCNMHVATPAAPTKQRKTWTDK